MILNFCAVLDIEGEITDLGNSIIKVADSYPRGRWFEFQVSKYSVR